MFGAWNGRHVTVLSCARKVEGNRWCAIDRPLLLRRISCASTIPAEKLSAQIIDTWKTTTTRSDLHRHTRSHGEPVRTGGSQQLNCHLGAHSSSAAPALETPPPPLPHSRRPLRTTTRPFHKKQHNPRTLAAVSCTFGRALTPLARCRLQPYFAGWMTKLGFQSGKWQRRYFVLTRNKLAYYSKLGGTSKGVRLAAIVPPRQLYSLARKAPPPCCWRRAWAARGPTT